LSIPLKLRGPRTAKKNVAISTTVINGSNGTAVQDAKVNADDGESVVTGITDRYGGAKLELTETGLYTVRAARGTDIPSNVLKVDVSA
jgi:hypothetical protein